MKYIKLFMGSVPALAGILLVVLTVVNLILVQDSFLNYTNEKYSVHKTLSMSEKDLEKVVHSMISYVKGKSDSPQIAVEIRGEETDFFNKKEIGHLEDVRALVKNIYVTMLVLFIISAVGEIILFVRKEWNIIWKGVLIAWGVLLVLTACIGITALVDIDRVITGFHQMFLSDSKWVLNPAKDRSVWMFRTNMYADVIATLGIIVALVAIGTIGGTRLLTKEKNKHSFT